MQKCSPGISRPATATEGTIDTRSRIQQLSEIGILVDAISKSLKGLNSHQAPLTAMRKLATCRLAIYRKEATSTHLSEVMGFKASSTGSQPRCFTTASFQLLSCWTFVEHSMLKRRLETKCLPAAQQYHNNRSSHHISKFL